MDWTKLLEQSPTIGVLAFVVWMFLRHLDKRDAAQGQLLKEISTACHSNQHDATEAIKENTAALGEVRLALVDCRK